MEENRWAFKVFSTDGRLGRLQFAYVFFLCIIGFAACSAGLVLCKLTFLVGAAYLAVCVMLFWAYTAAAIKRFHDLDRPGTDFFFLLIPVYDIYIFIKLFFFRSKPEAGELWERQSKAHYWMVPLFVLLIPAMFLGIGAGYQISRGRPIIPTISHYYDETNILSFDMPSNVSISRTAESTGEKPFSEYTQEDFAKLSENFGTPEAFLKYEYNLEDDQLYGPVDSITDFTYRLEYINGKRFVHLTIQSKPVWGMTFTSHIIFGVYESKKYKFQFDIQAEDGLIYRYYMEKAIQTIRVGKDAIP